MTADTQAQGDLAPCPFCGNSGKRDPRHTFAQTLGTVAVRCGQCGAEGPFERAGLDCEARALAAWNRRAAALQGRGTQEGEPSDAAEPVYSAALNDYRRRNPVTPEEPRK